MRSIAIDITHRGTTVTYTAQPVDQSSSFIPTHFRSKRIIHTGNCVVHRGGLVFEETQEPLDTVCKVVLGDLSRVRREAQLYVSHDHLHTLQGHTVPRFYGYYECKYELEEREVDMGFMVLEYCGERIPRKLLDRLDVKRSIIYLLIIIHHEASLTHGDFSDGSFSHVLYRDMEEGPDYRIIDFDRAMTHKCGLSMPVRLTDYEPSPAKFGCMELYDTAQYLDIWTPTWIDFLGRSYSIFQVASVERLVTCSMADHKDSNYTEEEIREEAEAYLANYFAIYGPRFKSIGHPLEFKRKLNLPGVEEPEDEVIPVRSPCAWESRV